MATQYLFLDNDKKEKFDLGTAHWGNILPSNKSGEFAESFVLQDLFLDENHLAQEMMTLTRNNKSYYETLEEAIYVANKIWNWSQGRTLYYSNDCVMGLPIEDGSEIYDHEFKYTGSRYG